MFCFFVLLVSCNILLAGFLSCKELAKSHAQNLNQKENPALSYSDVELQVCSVLLFGGQYRRRDIAKALPGSLTRLIHPLPTLPLSRWSQTQNVGQSVVKHIKTCWDINFHLNLLPEHGNCLHCLDSWLPNSTIFVVVHWVFALTYHDNKEI